MAGKSKILRISATTKSGVRAGTLERYNWTHEYKRCINCGHTRMEHVSFTDPATGDILMICDRCECKDFEEE